MGVNPADGRIALGSEARNVMLQLAAAPDRRESLLEADMRERSLLRIPAYGNVRKVQKAR